jgi:hypothetical protein
MNMKRVLVSLVFATLVVGMVGILSVPAPATKLATPAMSGHEGGCSARKGAGRWGYSFSGTIVGLGPATGVGSQTVNPDGTFSGSQTRSFNGDVEEETYTGTVLVNSDCTFTATANVYLNGALERTDVLPGVFTDDERSFRAMINTPETAILFEASKIE